VEAPGIASECGEDVGQCLDRTARWLIRFSLSEHFAKWSAVGLTLGKLEEAMFLMEAQNNSGTIDVTATVTLQ